MILIGNDLWEVFSTWFSLWFINFHWRQRMSSKRKYLFPRFFGTIFSPILPSLYVVCRQILVGWGAVITQRRADNFVRKLEVRCEMPRCAALADSQVYVTVQPSPLHWLHRLLAPLTLQPEYRISVSLPFLESRMFVDFFNTDIFETT